MRFLDNLTASVELPPVVLYMVVRNVARGERMAMCKNWNLAAYQTGQSGNSYVLT